MINKKKTILNSKQRILKIASELFSELGFLGVSMANIAQRLNFTKAALYYHFRNKKELYLEVLEKSFQNLIKTLNRVANNPKSPEQGLSQIIRSYLKVGLKEKNLIKSLIATSPRECPEIRKYIAKLRKEVNHRFQISLEKILKRKGDLEKVDLKFITSVILGIMDRFILEAEMFKKRLKIEEKTSQILEVISLILKGRRQKSSII